MSWMVVLRGRCDESAESCFSGGATVIRHQSSATSAKSCMSLRWQEISARCFHYANTQTPSAAEHQQQAGAESRRMMLGCSVRERERRKRLGHASPALCPSYTQNCYRHVSRSLAVGRACPAETPTTRVSRGWILEDASAINRAWTADRSGTTK